MTPPPPPSQPPPPGGYSSPSPAGSPWGTLAEWGPRALGLLIDYAVGIAAWVVIFFVALIFSAVSTTLGLLVYFVGSVAELGWFIWLGMQVGQTGSSPGMRVIGLRCVGKETGQPIGAGMGVVRGLAHIVDNIICYIGWLFPLWDTDKQTLADKIMTTVVVEAPKQPFSLAPPTGTSAY
jgi:uncharacterized RDD family membrane protein YckC